MNLSQVREAFRTLSGRFDLTDENSGLMADFLINSGSQFLDRLSEVQKTWASSYQFAAIGSWNVQFPHCRAVKEVWASSAVTAPLTVAPVTLAPGTAVWRPTSARWQLEKKNLQDILASYYTELVSLMDTGTVLYYSPAVTRHVPEDAVADPDIPTFTDVLTSTGYGYNAIIFAPPTDVRLLIEVVGLFYSIKLVKDTDENFWSSVHPALLIKAALREVEVFNRNTTGVKDWENAIKTDLNAISSDLVEEIISEVDQMEG